MWHYFHKDDFLVFSMLLNNSESETGFSIAAVEKHSYGNKGQGTEDFKLQRPPFVKLTSNKVKNCPEARNTLSFTSPPCNFAAAAINFCNYWPLFW